MLHENLTGVSTQSRLRFWDCNFPKVNPSQGISSPSGTCRCSDIAESSRDSQAHLYAPPRNHSQASSRSCEYSRQSMSDDCADTELIHTNHTFRTYYIFIYYIIIIYLYIYYIILYIVVGGTTGRLVVSCVFDCLFVFVCFYASRAPCFILVQATCHATLAG